MCGVRSKKKKASVCGVIERECGPKEKLMTVRVTAIVMIAVILISVHKSKKSTRKSKSYRRWRKGMNV